MKTISINGIIVGVVLLVIGFGAGYVTRGTEDPQMDGYLMSSSMSGSHVMTGGSMKDTMDDMSAGLQGKTGDQFDKAFLSEMIVHHEGAVTMAQAALKTSKRPELINLANSIISAQTKEINMMKEWQKTWFNQ